MRMVIDIFPLLLENMFQPTVHPSHLHRFSQRLQAGEVREAEVARVEGCQGAEALWPLGEVGRPQRQAMNYIYKYINIKLLVMLFLFVEKKEDVITKYVCFWQFPTKNIFSSLYKSIVLLTVGLERGCISFQLSPEPRKGTAIGLLREECHVLVRHAGACGRGRRGFDSFVIYEKR